MSNFLINIRIGVYHVQLTRQLRMRVLTNECHRGYPYGRFQVYEFLWFQGDNNV